MIDNEIKNILSRAYNKKSVDRDQSSIQPWKVKERDVFYSYLKKENKSSLLEIGAGTGKDSLFFNERGIKTFSTDLSPDSVKLCKEKGLEAKVMSFDQLDIPNNQFDSVWALNCLLHVPKKNLNKVLKEIDRVLYSEGLFYMGVYGGENHEGVWEDDFYVPKRFFSFFEDYSIKEVLSEVFEIEYFNCVPKEVVGGKFHFQSIILRKRSVVL